MNAREILMARSAELQHQALALHDKYRAARQQAEAIRLEWRKVEAAMAEVHRMRMAVERLGSDEENAASLDLEMGLKISSMIKSHLARHEPGLSSGQLFELLGESAGVKRSTISATLYNMKKRGEVEHCEVSGKYRIPSRQHRMISPR
jgi:hypothetical protein